MCVRCPAPTRARGDLPLAWRSRTPPLDAAHVPHVYVCFCVLRSGPLRWRGRGGLGALVLGLVWFRSLARRRAARVWCARRRLLSWAVSRVLVWVFARAGRVEGCPQAVERASSTYVGCASVARHSSPSCGLCAVRRAFGPGRAVCLNIPFNVNVNIKNKPHQLLLRMQHQ
ncbi:hypothetical protein DENSPDRAFT_448823 [Dentipellis sp. KUC8613]|nr:hypothetical protein DENSPDRAFT_448823 [Dentipellis sp. KUC8613]